MMLACMLAGILVSGVLSQMVLSGVELRLELPEHIFAGRPLLALAELVNHKQTLPSFSLRLVGKNKLPKTKASQAKPGYEAQKEILSQPVYFPYIPHRQTVRQNVELTFPRRGIYRQDALGLQTKFPFGFLEKTRRVQSSLQAVVYPSVEPTEELFDILPLVSGELESYMRGRGHDIYAIRDYQTTDNVHHVDWKASAKTGELQVREFAREDERRVLLVLDTTLNEDLASPAAGAPPANANSARAAAAFERAVTLCASLAWHFYQTDAVLGFRTIGFETPVAPADEVIYDVLGQLATAAPTSSAANKLFDELADSPDLFKIILTCQPKGSLPAAELMGSYVLYLNS
jgi:uncharacterized protein (DUF58 family)